MSAPFASPRVLASSTVLLALGACALPAYDVANGTGANGGEGPGGSGGDAGADVGGGGAGGVGDGGAGGISVGPTWRKPIAFNASILDEELEGFPMAVKLELDDDLAAHASEDGSDIRFVAEDGTPLVHEVERYVSDGSLAAWVRIPTLPAGAMTTIFMVYGAGEAQPSPAPVVWDDRFAGVWHLSESDDSSFFADSSLETHVGNVVAPATRPTADIGLMGGAFSFDGLEDRISFNDPDGLNFGTESFSFSLWLWQGMNPGLWDAPWHKGGGNNDNPGYAFFLGKDGWVASINDGTNNQPVTLAPDSAGLADDWHHVLAVVDRTEQEMYAYLNGALVDTKPIVAVGSVSGSQPAQLSHQESASSFDGLIDEVHVYRMVVSPSWARAEVASVRGDSDFITIGPEQPLDGG